METFVEFDKERLVRFKKAYEACLMHHRQSFTFENNEFLCDYAKYVILYVEEHFKKGAQDA